MSEDIYITGSFRGHALSTCFFMTQSQQIPILDSIKKGSPHFFQTILIFTVLITFIYLYIDQIPFIANKSQSEVLTKKKNDIYDILSARRICWC